MPAARTRTATTQRGTALGSANTPTGLSTPDLLAYIKTNAEQYCNSFSNSLVAPFLGTAGMPTMQDIRNQLFSSGYNRRQINQILNTQPSFWSRLLHTAGQSAIFPPGIPAGTVGGAATGGAAATEGAAAGAGVSTATKVGAGLVAGTGLVSGITGSLDFLKWIAWILHPLNLLRAVEFLTGLGTMFYGMSILMGVMRRGQATHRSTLRTMLAATPLGRTQAMRRARRRGRRAGEIQAERDVAYRGARQERARSVGAEKRRLGETGGTGGTGGIGEPV